MTQDRPSYVKSLPEEETLALMQFAQQANPVSSFTQASYPFPSQSFNPISNSHPAKAQLPLLSIVINDIVSFLKAFPVPTLTPFTSLNILLSHLLSCSCFHMCPIQFLILSIYVFLVFSYVFVFSLTRFKLPEERGPL